MANGSVDRERAGRGGVANGSRGRGGPRRARLLPALVVGVVLLGGCGHRGSPVPPLPNVPFAPRDVEWRQRGAALELRASYRLAALGDRRLREVAEPRLLTLEPSNPADLAGWDGAPREREFLRLARPAPLPPLESAEPGAVVVRTDSVPVAALTAGGPVVVGLAVADGPRLSAVPTRRVLRPALPPLAPAERPAAMPEEKGIRLRWAEPADARAQAVAIYRHRDGEPEPWRPWRVVPRAERALLDEEARYDETLVYRITVQTAARDGELAVESVPTAALTVAYRDVFPPLPPREADALAEVGRIRVAWFPGGSADEAAVVVERQFEGSAEWVEVGRVAVPESVFVDGGVGAERPARYRLVAIDRVGNRAAPARPTGWVAARAPAAP